MEKPPLKAFGRSLSDFNTLSRAEQKLLKDCGKGQLAEISKHHPEQPTEQNIVRANFVRFLALGGDEQNPVHENGIKLSGGWIIEDELNLANTTVPHSIWLINCRVATISLRYSNFHGFISFEGCHVDSLIGDFIVCKRDVFLDKGFTSAKTVSFTSAQIDGSLDCSDANFNDVRSGKNHVGALVCDGALLGHVHLNNSFFTGEVRFSSVQIKGDLECYESKFNGMASGDALRCSGAKITGSVILNSEFIGTVCLSGAQIGFYLNCSGTTFDGTNSITSDCPNGLALQAENMIVMGIFIFKNLQSVKGAISLMTAKVGTLEDDIKSWSQGNLALDGFVYDRLAGSAPTKNRLAWLDKQSKSHAGLDGMGKEFRPQPWQQLQKVLREMGHIEDARQVAIKFEDRLHKANLIGQTPEDWCKPKVWLYRKISRRFHWLFGWLIGYGYRPLGLLFKMFVVWLVCGVIYWGAAVYGNNGNGVFAPSNPLVFQNPDYDVCKADKDEAKFQLNKFDCSTPSTQGAGNWYLCSTLRAEYTGFSPLAYSLDLILPLVDLQQENDWSPMIPTPKNSIIDEFSAFSLKHFTRLVMWFEILFGWIASLLLVAVVSGLTKRREE